MPETRTPRVRPESLARREILSARGTVNASGVLRQLIIIQFKRSISRELRPCWNWRRPYDGRRSAFRTSGVIPAYNPCPPGYVWNDDLGRCVSNPPPPCPPGYFRNKLGVCVTMPTIPCPSGETRCDGQCVNLDSDVDNCGFCGNSCAKGKTCLKGVCECPSGETNCSGVCTDLNSDSNNCGSCGSTCQQGYGTCCGGRCCPEGYGTCCNGQCCPDPYFCCGSSCCSNGELGNGPQACCNGSCQPQDDQHCGFSCESCGGGQTCQLDPSTGYRSYSCLCPNGETLCNSTCVDINSDPNNCGNCGNTCGAGTCQAGACMCDGILCSQGQPCCNGFCMMAELPNPFLAGGGSSNYTLINNCQSIFPPNDANNNGLTVSFTAGAQGIVSSNGFSFQLNTTTTNTSASNRCNASTNLCQCPSPSGVCWMQYVITVTGNQAAAFIQYFDNAGILYGSNNSPPIYDNLPQANSLPANWTLSITLSNDNDGNVSGYMLSVLDDAGQTMGSVETGVTPGFELPTFAPNATTPVLVPIMGVSAVLAGIPGCTPQCCQDAGFTSGGGNINYDSANSQLCFQGNQTCSNVAEFWNAACEQAVNVNYGAIPCCGSSITQTVSLT